MSIEDRTKWMELFIQRTNCTDCFNNIMGVLDFFKAENMGNPGSWISMVDAGIIHGIAQGWGLYTEQITSSENWGAEAWRSFFVGYFEDNLSYNELRPKWAAGENGSTWYGVAKAGEDNRRARTQELGLLAVTQVYRDNTSVNDGRPWQQGFTTSPWYFDPFNPNSRQLIFWSAELYWRTTNPIYGYPIP